MNPVSNRVELMITPYGAFRVNTSYQPIDINQAVLNQLSTTVIRKLPAALPGAVLKGGPKYPIGIAVSGNHVCWSVELDVLQINTNFATTADGKVVYPCPTDHKLPVMQIPWIVPANMRLMLMVMATQGDYGVIAQYFIAVDNSGRFYILPMGNIYEDGKLCSGKYVESRSSCFDALQDAWLQFNSSRWQGDLSETVEVAKTQALFSFKVDNSKFTQLFPTDGSQDWTKFAVKIANEAIAGNIVTNPTKGVF